ncbi:sensor histidine kinase [Phyllobacterium salinisoli]|uniref:histidine kinase n=1 Tax=Phyllobacterium salinisoli TaxID=1899321 RepID=A0A368JWW4_9HYPH|nr:ATP-binding protein [Phyllobacterium salinisoli]RCS21646.1 sensor histidine kinase [Phyllobacterium salinisoli]
MKSPTLTWKLFIRITPTILVTLVVIGALAFRSATREINNIYDAQLINDANVLWALLEKPLEAPGPDTPKHIKRLDFAMGNQLSLNEDVDDYADAHMFRVWKDGKIRVFSSHALPASVPIAQTRLSDVTYHHKRWRVYSLPISDKNIVIEVGEELQLRETLVANILLNLFFPLLVMVPIIGLLIWFSIYNGLRTIRDLINQIRSRSPDDLSVIPVVTLPQDLVPLGRSINQLLAKLDRSLMAERCFADNAAHQLRTPHAGIKLLLQMLEKADTDEERRMIIANLVQGNENAMRLIEQLLRAGRVGHQPMELKSVALYRTTASVVAEMGHSITSKQQDVALEGVVGARVNADEPLLRLLIGNLMENAIKYTPDKGSIAITIHEAGDKWILSICDNGPGIAPEHREAVFQRFYRVGTPETEGAGLGLSIVADIAERLSAVVSLGAPLADKGLRVDVAFAKSKPIVASSVPSRARSAAL